MTVNQQKKILKKIQLLELDIEKLEKVRIDLLSSGYASASMSSGGGSRSYTRMDVDKITNSIQILKTEVKNLKKILNGSKKSTPKTINIYYS